MFSPFFSFFDKCFLHFACACALQKYEAMRCLGICYSHGKGVGQDLEAAVQWHYQAAAKGHHKSMFSLSCTEFTGVLDFAERAEWCRRAVEEAKAAGDAATVAYYEVQLARYRFDADAAEKKDRAASKAIKAALKEDPGNATRAKSLALNLEQLRLTRECSACGASPLKDSTVKLRVCDRCHAAWFCSLECLKSAWPDHKPECERVVAEKKAAKAEKKKKK